MVNMVARLGRSSSAHVYPESHVLRRPLATEASCRVSVVLYPASRRRHATYNLRICNGRRGTRRNIQLGHVRGLCRSRWPVTKDVNRAFFRGLFFACALSSYLPLASLSQAPAFVVDPKGRARATRVSLSAQRALWETPWVTSHFRRMLADREAPAAPAIFASTRGNPEASVLFSARTASTADIFPPLPAAQPQLCPFQHVRSDRIAR